MEKNFFDGYQTLDELIANVDLGTLVGATQEGVLQQWLTDHFYGEQASMLTLDRIKEVGTDELRLMLCEELRLDLMGLSDYDTRAIERALARRRKKIVYIDFEAGDPEGEIAENQAELMNLIFKDGGAVIYLCGGEFQIPMTKRSMTYIGRDGAIINVAARDFVDFDAADITLKDITLYLQHITPEDVALEHSERVKFILGKRLTLDGQLTRREIYRFLQGRDAFERFEDFAQRAVMMRGIVIGEALLEPSDFDITRNIFELRPKWRADFLKVVKKFARDKYFSVLVDAASARSIFEDERKQLIYADFGTDGSDAAIRVMYLHTSAVGRLLILLTDKPPMQVFDALIDGGAGSGSGGAGYGLELIAAFNEMNYD